MKLTEAAETFIKFLKQEKRSPSTIIAYSKDIDQLNAYLSKETKPEKVEDVKSEHLNSYIEKLKSDKKTQYTLKTISRKINSMKSFFKFLYLKKVVKNDPAQSVKHPKYIVSPPRVLSKLEYRALRDVSRYNPRLFTIVELLLQTGIRIGELTRLNIEDVNIASNRGSLTINQFASNSKRAIPLNEPAVLAIKNYLNMRPNSGKNTDALFLTKTGNPLLVRNVRTSITRAFEKAGIDDATVNDIRNTFIIHQLRSGMSAEQVARIVGHKRLTSTKKYQRLIENKPKRKTNKIVPL